MTNEAEVVFATLARHLASQPSEADVLAAVVEQAVELLPECEDAGIMLLTKGGEVETPVATSQRVRDSDAAQAEAGEGPCFDASLQRGEHNEVFRCEDARTDPRWPVYLPRARELGVGSMLGFQLFHHEEVFGSLNLYSSRPGAMGPRMERLGWVLASHAAVALTSTRTSSQLHTALDSARIIGQALGMVRVRYDLDETQALAALKRLSQSHNTKLNELAGTIVEAGGKLPA